MMFLDQVIESQSSAEVTCDSLCDSTVCLLGKGISAGYKATQSQDKPTSLSACIKPFAGKVFYLDLPSNRITETLENDIKELGGVRKDYFYYYY